MNKYMFKMIVGPMKSGKSYELIRLIHRFKIAGKKIVVFNHVLNTRDDNKVKSRGGCEYDAVKVSNSLDVIKIVTKNSYDTIFIDEIQFFDEGIINIIKDCVRNGIRVIASGLDLNYKGEPFNNVIPHLLAIADSVDKLTAICSKCGSDYATRTHRLDNNIDDVLYVGIESTYEPLCVTCFYNKGIK